MEIAWLGHSCVRLRSGGTTLITDPYDKSVGFAMGPQPADIVTISHDHPHHAYHEAVTGGPRVLRGPGEYEIANFYVTGMGTDRGNGEGTNVNTVFTLQAEELSLCHLGDLNRMLSPRQLDALGHTDVLFVPSGGLCTIDTPRLAQIVNLIGPKIVVPLHYRSNGVRVDLLPVEAFLDDMGVDDATRVAKLNVTATSLPRELSLVLLERSSSVA